MRVIDMYNMVYDSDIIKIRESEEFARWFLRLRDEGAVARIVMRMTRIRTTGSVGDHRGVGDGVNEIRIDYGPGYRLYYSWRGNDLILLLAGGDKSSQRRDIERAKRLNREYE